jgi:hypothetical protein
MHHEIEHACHAANVARVQPKRVVRVAHTRSRNKIPPKEGRTHGHAELDACHVVRDRVSHRLERSSHARCRYRYDNVDKMVLVMCAGWIGDIHVARVFALCLHQGSVWPSIVCSS